MKTLTAIGAVKVKLILGLLCLLILSNTSLSAEILTELTLGTYGRTGIVVFPSHAVREFKVDYQSPEIVSIDFYDWKINGAQKIIPGPHPQVKFLRVSQVSRQPDVVRAVIVFNEPSRYTPRRIGKNLVLEGGAPLKSKNNNQFAGGMNVPDNKNFVSTKNSSDTVLDKDAQP